MYVGGWTPQWATPENIIFPARWISWIQILPLTEDAPELLNIEFIAVSQSVQPPRPNSEYPSSSTADGEIRITSARMVYIPR